jgi:HemY protein
MIRLIVKFGLIAAAAALFAWLADRPGQLRVDWLGYQVDVSVLGGLLLVLAVVVVLWLAFRLTAGFFALPWTMGGYFRGQRQQRGQSAVARGLVAAAAGDVETARREARVAVRVLGDDPLARLLEAQAAQLAGDHGRVSRLFQSMAEHADTQLLGLRGLYVEARRQGEEQRARDLAEQANARNPALAWAASAVLADRSARGDWPAVERLIDSQRRVKAIDERTAAQRRAVVLTAQALEAEKTEPARALDLALKAHRLDPSLIPAAVIAGQHYVAAGNIRKARRIVERTWMLNPHPDLAYIYSHARAGDSPHDRLRRVRELTRMSSGGEEGAAALARAAIEAHAWQEARDELRPYSALAPRARICTLMAEIEEGEHGDRGRVREWLARAVRAARDPAWTADGIISESWLPVSPATGELGAFRWRVPVERLGGGFAEDIDERLLPQERPATEPASDGQPRAPQAVGEGPDEHRSATAETKALPDRLAGDGAGAPAAASVPASPPALPSLPPPKRPNAQDPFHQPDDPGPESLRAKRDTRDWTEKLAGT